MQIQEAVSDKMMRDVALDGRERKVVLVAVWWWMAGCCFSG